MNKTLAENVKEGASSTLSKGQRRLFSKACDVYSAPRRKSNNDRPIRFGLHSQLRETLLVYKNAVRSHGGRMVSIFGDAEYIVAPDDFAQKAQKQPLSRIISSSSFWASIELGSMSVLSQKGATPGNNTFTAYTEGSQHGGGPPMNAGDTAFFCFTVDTLRKEDPTLTWKLIYEYCAKHSPRPSNPEYWIDLNDNEGTDDVQADGLSASNGDRTAGGSGRRQKEAQAEKPSGLFSQESGPMKFWIHPVAETDIVELASIIRGHGGLVYDDDSQADFAIVRRADNTLTKAEYLQLLKHCKGGIVDPHWIHRCIGQDEVLAIGAYGYPATYVDSNSESATQNGSPAPSKSLSGCDEGQDEEDQPTGGAPTPQYTQREKWLIRETYKKEIRRGNLFNPVLPATWKPFHHLFPGRTSGDLSENARRHPSIFNDSATPNLDYGSDDLPSRDLKPTRRDVSAGVLSSSANEDEDQNEKSGAARSAGPRKYTQTERQLMRDIRNKELARGVVINLKSPLTWNPFSHLFPGRSGRGLAWQAVRHASIFEDSSDEDSDPEGNDHPSQTLKEPRRSSQSSDAAQTSGPSARQIGHPTRNPLNKSIPQLSEKEERLLLDWASRMEALTGRSPRGQKTWARFVDKYRLPGSADFYYQAYQRLRQSIHKAPLIDTPTSIQPRKRTRESKASSDIGSERASKRIKSKPNQPRGALSWSSKERDANRNPVLEGSSSSSDAVNRRAVNVSSDDFRILAGHFMKSKPSPNLHGHGDIVDSLLALSNSEEGRHHPVSWWLAAYYADAELFDQLGQRLQSE